MNIKQTVARCLSNFYYPFFRRRKFHIMSIDETIDFMETEGNSVIRFGDGEFAILCGKDITNYQVFDYGLQEKMTKAVTALNNPNLLICLPESLKSLDFCRKESRKNWKLDFFRNRYAYNKYHSGTYRYGNAFVSRPYMIYSDKSKCGLWFEKILNLFAGKNIVLIEGEYSRSGVGNNLFQNAKSVKRILCTSKNAFSRYEDILDTVLEKVNKDSLILTAIGPTSKPLALALVEQGYRVLDIGHLDSEYEWYLHESTSKDKIHGKHTAENGDDSDIGACEDVAYLESVIADLSK